MDALTSQERRALAARANRLKAQITLGGEVTDSNVAHVRRRFEQADLLKVRFSTDDRALCDRLASELAERAGCLLVQRVGRVATLFLSRGAES
jgi:RNA-binding protein YhbY